MNILELLQQYSHGPLKTCLGVYTAQEVYDICCAILEESYLLKTGAYIPADMEEKFAPGYAEACNDQHRKICEIKKILKEALQ